MPVHAIFVYVWICWKVWDSLSWERGFPSLLTVGPAHAGGVLGRGWSSQHDVIRAVTWGCMGTEWGTACCCQLGEQQARCLKSTNAGVCYSAGQLAKYSVKVLVCQQVLLGTHNKLGINWILTENCCVRNGLLGAALCVRYSVSQFVQHKIGKYTNSILRDSVASL